MSRPFMVQEANLSEAWYRAFAEVLHSGEISPLVVVVDNIGNDGPAEVPEIRRALDTELVRQGKQSCHTVANTIFPSMWNREAKREELYDRYRRILPSMRRHGRNIHGLYFERLIDFGHDSEYQGGINQLEHIINTWNRGNHRRSALQAGIFDPRSDHSNQRQRGFPCLQQVAFARHGLQGLSVTGFYATQYIFERAYGNYLGLCRLGQFMGKEMGLHFSRMVCIATPAVLGHCKGALRRFAEDMAPAIGNFGTTPLRSGSRDSNE